MATHDGDVLTDEDPLGDDAAGYRRASTNKQNPSGTCTTASTADMEETDARGPSTQNSEVGRSNGVSGTDAGTPASDEVARDLATFGASP